MMGKVRGQSSESGWLPLWALPVSSGGGAGLAGSPHPPRQSLSSPNCQQFVNENPFLANTTEPPLRRLCLDASAIDDVDYSAAETLRAIHAMLKARGIRLIVAEEMKDLTGKARYQLREPFGEEAFCDHLEDVMRQCRQRFNWSVPSKRFDPTPEGVDPGATRGE